MSAKFIHARGEIHFLVVKAKILISYYVPKAPDYDARSFKEFEFMLPQAAHALAELDWEVLEIEIIDEGLVVVLFFKPEVNSVGF